MLKLLLCYQSKMHLSGTKFHVVEKKTKCIKIDNEDMVAEAFRISTKELQPKI